MKHLDFTKCRHSTNLEAAGWAPRARARRKNVSSYLTSGQACGKNWAPMFCHPLALGPIKSGVIAKLAPEGSSFSTVGFFYRIAAWRLSTPAPHSGGRGCCPAIAQIPPPLPKVEVAAKRLRSLPDEKVKPNPDRASSCTQPSDQHHYTDGFQAVTPNQSLPWLNTSFINTSIASLRSPARVVARIRHPFLVRKLQTKRG